VSFSYEHTPYAVNADDNQPLFFRRRYGGNPEPRGQVMIHGRPMDVISLVPEEPIYIYGYSYDSEYAEDRVLQRDAWERARRFWACCFSVMCPEGEPGSVPLDEVEPITREDFEAAAARGWNGR
jgi:hypothetical protein